MAVSKMKMVNIIGQYKHLDDIIDIYAGSGCYHPEQTIDIMSDVSGFSAINEDNPFNAAMTKFNEILNDLGIVPEEIDGGKEKIGIDEISGYVDELEENVGKRQQERKLLIQDISELDITIEQLDHFKKFEFDLDKVFASEFIKVRFGRIPFGSYAKLEEYNDNPYVVFLPTSNDDNYYWGLYVAPLESSDEVDRIFSTLFFERLRIPSSNGTPAETLVSLKKKHRDNSLRVAEIGEEISKYMDKEHDRCMEKYSQVKWQYDAFALRRYGARYNNSFMQVGWVPEKEEKKITDKLNEIEGIEYNVENPEAASSRTNPPTKLKNPKLFKPFEYYIEMYGLPNYKEFDPTVFVAITYTIFFGIMFADLGQGLVLSVVGFLMYKFENMDIGKILIPCGISGAFFGTIFGSVFGFEEALNPLYHMLGFEEKPIDVMSSAMSLLMLSIALGIVLIIFAMVINIITSFKRGNKGKAIFNPSGVCGLSVFGGIVAVALAMVMNAENFPSMPIIIVFIALPLVLLLFSEPLANLVDRKKDWQPENWGEYMLESFFELFETLLSYVTNTVSFMRVGAFVLVHAGMMLVFFSLAELVGGGIPGAIMIIFGNILVLVLEGLLVGVQALRLEFYEMFSRFFDGDGRNFTPVKIEFQSKNN